MHNLIAAFRSQPAAIAPDMIHSDKVSYMTDSGRVTIISRLVSQHVYGYLFSAGYQPSGINPHKSHAQEHYYEDGSASHTDSSHLIRVDPAIHAKRMAMNSKDYLTTAVCMVQQLVCVDRVTLNMAQAIQKKFQTMSQLDRAFDEQGETILVSADLMFQTQSRGHTQGGLREFKPTQSRSICRALHDEIEVAEGGLIQLTGSSEADEIKSFRKRKSKPTKMDQEEYEQHQAMQNVIRQLETGKKRTKPNDKLQGRFLHPSLQES